MHAAVNCQASSGVSCVLTLPALVPVWHVAILAVCRAKRLAQVGCGRCCSCCSCTAQHYACTSCRCVHRLGLSPPLLLLCCTGNETGPLLLQQRCYTRAMAAVKLPCCLHRQKVSASCCNSVTDRSCCGITRSNNTCAMIERYKRFCCWRRGPLRRFVAVTICRQHVALLLAPKIALTDAVEHAHRLINASKRTQI
jgi:hypothetical protein